MKTVRGQRSSNTIRFNTVIAKTEPMQIVQLVQVVQTVKVLNLKYGQGVTTRWSLGAGLRGNGERMRK